MTPERPSRVFIVDDDGSVRKALRRLVASAGFEVLDFDSARAFLEAVPADAAGCLVLDLHMPDMDGFGLQRALRDRDSTLRIVVVTAFAQPGDREKAHRLGAVGFLEKPVEEADLFALIG